VFVLLSCTAIISNSIVYYYPVFARVAAVKKNSLELPSPYPRPDTNENEAKKGAAAARRHTICGFGGPINRIIKLVISS